jgi:hypothetical protein
MSKATTESTRTRNYSWPARVILSEPTCSTPSCVSSSTSYTQFFSITIAMSLDRSFTMLRMWSTTTAVDGLPRGTTPLQSDKPNARHHKLHEQLAVSVLHSNDSLNTARHCDSNLPTYLPTYPATLSTNHDRQESRLTVPNSEVSEPERGV